MPARSHSSIVVGGTFSKEAEGAEADGAVAEVMSALGGGAPGLGSQASVIVVARSAHPVAAGWRLKTQPFGRDRSPGKDEA